MQLLVGLGNPGAEYNQTRHNIGFMAVDMIVHRFSFSAPRMKFHGEMSEGMIEGKKVISFKPMTYMNLSGNPVQELVRFYKIPLEKIMILHDELDIPLQKVKIKTGGGAGGHNGIKSLDSHIGKDYRRLRIGIGHPGNKHQVTNYVLGKFSKDEQISVETELDILAKHIGLLIKGDEQAFLKQFAQAMKPRNDTSKV